MKSRERSVHSGVSQEAAILCCRFSGFHAVCHLYKENDGEEMVAMGKRSA